MWKEDILRTCKKTYADWQLEPLSLQCILYISVFQVPEVTLTAQGQKDKLRVVLSKVNELLELARWDETKWSVDGEN